MKVVKPSHRLTVSQNSMLLSTTGSPQLRTSEVHVSLRLTVNPTLLATMSV